MKRTKYETALQKVGQPLRLMVIDDNMDSAQTAAMLLEAHGHQVVVEYDAASALESAVTEMPRSC
jgi:CheY-like chemotaxis protein